MLDAEDILAWCVDHGAGSVGTSVVVEVSVDEIGTYHCGPCYARAGSCQKVDTQLVDAAGRGCKNCGLVLVRRTPLLSGVARLIEYDQMSSRPTVSRDPLELVGDIKHCFLARKRVQVLGASLSPGLEPACEWLSERIEAYARGLFVQLRSVKVSPGIGENRRFIVAATYLPTDAQFEHCVALTYGERCDLVDSWYRGPVVAAVSERVVEELKCAVEGGPLHQVFYQSCELKDDDDVERMIEVLRAIWVPHEMSIVMAADVARACMS
jgi:hypothetical protein